ncbi:ATP-binding protein [Actinomadura hibisca]|uniref:ATP-binding protein n=1 Tax=Actinomadura hibisca TaxID=68565 RepID=UPI000A058594|nr:hypothetical protein [Actinomadura hibisca]
MGNLPAELPGFVGRGGELREIDERLRAFRLVTLTGAAGVGKTRTALQVGAQARDRFRDGVWLVPLSSVLDPALVPPSVARELQVRDLTTRTATDLLAKHLADRECLLILDACEHLADACARLVEAVLAASPGTRVLVTGRQALNVADESVLVLHPLPVPKAGPPEVISQYASVELLTRRVRDTDPGFRVDDDNAAAVALLCRRLDGLPLALELAAAQLRRLPLEELAGRPDLRAVSPVFPASEVLAPHGGLWTAIGWSHQLCTPAERLLWARLSVFAGDFTLEAAREVCGGGPVEDVAGVLNALVAGSVVTCANERYRLLESLRAYGAHWLAELGEDDVLRARHRDRYLSMARQAFPEWARAGQVAWYRRLSDEYAEVRAAIETCLAEPGPAALELTGHLWFLWFACEYERDGRGYLERALAHDRSPGPSRVRAMLALGCVMITQGDMDGLGRCVAECRAAASDLTALRAADYLECTEWATTGRFEESLNGLARLAATTPQDPMQETIWLLAMAALVFARLGMKDYAAATDLAEELCREGELRGEQKFRSWGHYIRALVALSDGDHETAAGHARVAYNGYRQLNDMANMALSLEVLAVVAQAQGASPRAAVLFGISDRLWHPGGGRARFTTPEMAATRQACERALIEELGQEMWEKFFQTGLHSSWP